MTDNTQNDALVVFMPSGKRGRFELGTPILNAARSLGVDVDSVCGGRAICGRCQVEIAGRGPTDGDVRSFQHNGVEGEFASQQFAEGEVDSDAADDGDRWRIVGESHGDLVRRDAGTANADGDPADPDGDPQRGRETLTGHRGHRERQQQEHGAEGYQDREAPEGETAPLHDYA